VNFGSLARYTKAVYPQKLIRKPTAFLTLMSDQGVGPMACHSPFAGVLGGVVPRFMASVAGGGGKRGHASLGT
jgi:hypothetical protein